MTLRGWHPETELRNLLTQVKKLIDTPQLERNLLMAISKEVQDQADKTRELTDIVKSLDQGFKALTSQVTDLTLKIANTPVGAPGLSEEDKAALVQSAQDTQGLIDTLKSDIPANTTPALPPATSTPVASPDQVTPDQAPPAQ